MGDWSGLSSQLSDSENLENVAEILGLDKYLRQRGKIKDSEEEKYEEKVSEYTESSEEEKISLVA